MARIGIMGGTFDPIHNGHLMLGRQACEEYQLDQIWFMPSGQPPHKKNHKVTDSKERLRMVELAVQSDPRFLCSDFEIQRPGNTYSAETLRLLKERYPEHQFFFIIGADSFYQIERWYHPEQVMEMVVLMVAGREYSDADCSMEEQKNKLEDLYGARILFLHCPELDVSSSELRRMAEAGRSIEGLVPEPVLHYIRSCGLYTNETAHFE